MRYRVELSGLVGLALLLAACGPSAAPPGGTAPAASKPATGAQPSGSPASGGSASGASAGSSASSSQASGGQAAGSQAGAAQRAPVDLQAYVPSALKDALDAYAVPTMKERYNVNLQMTARLSGEALTKAVAQKDNPEVSVFIMDEGPWLQAKQAGLWDTLDPAAIPNLGQVSARFRDADGQGAGVGIYALGLIYDEQTFRERGFPTPSSTMDLWNPAYRGRVTIPGAASTFSYALLFQANRIEGGDAAGSLDRGWAKMRELAP